MLGGLSEFTDYVFRFHATSGSPAAEAWSAPGTFQTPWENPPPLLGVPITTAIFADGATVTCPLVQAPATANTVVWADYFLGSATANEIIFTLPAAATAAAAHLWQYDRGGLTSRGFHTFDVSFSTDGGVTFPTTITLALAQGTGAPPTPVQTLGFAQQSGVTHIRFHNITNFGDPSWIGLSEVRFGSVGPLSLAQPTSSNIQSGQATVSTSVSQAVDAVTVYWDTIDHGPGSTGWSNTAGIGPRPAGAISHLLTGLAENVTYFVRFHATGVGGEVWSLPGSLTTGVAGSILTPDGVTAMSSLSAYPIVNTINSAGLNSSAPSALDWTHVATPSNSNNYSWLGTKAGNVIIYQLPGPSTVGSLYYWSYWGGTASRSLTAFDISFSPDGVTYSTPSTITLGTPGSAAEFFSLGTHANATHVRFSNLQNGGDTYAGIGEVRFGGQPSAPGGPFGGWADAFAGLTDSDPALDFDGGGLETGIEWVVGGDPSDGGDDAGNAPTIDNTNATHFIFTFKRRDAAATDAYTDITVEYGSNLNGWAEAVHGTNGVLIDDSTDLGGGFHQVTVSVPRTLAAGGKLFARLKVVVSTTP